MTALLAAAILAALVAGVIGFLFGESNGKESEAGTPRVVCIDYKRVSSTATHGDYAGANGTTFSIRKDELPAGSENTDDNGFPKGLRVCVTIVAGQATTEVTAL